MKFPFFKSSQPEPKEPAKFLVVPPRVASSATPQAQRPPERSFAAATAVATPAPTAPPTQVSTIPLCLGSVLAQLPATIFSVTDKAQLAAVTVAVPATLVVPQLGQGKIEVPLPDLFALLPKDMVQDQLPASCA